MSTKNAFLQNVNKGNTTTWNGAVSNSSTGSELADQFSKAGTYRGRTIDDVFADQSKLHRIYGLLALKFVFYLRLITRKVKLNENEITEAVQRGQGQRDESFKRLLWYALNEPEVFYRNLYILPLVGSFKDFYQLIFIAKENNVNLNFRRVLSTMLVHANHDLFLKYLPLVKANSKLKTERAKIRNEIAKQIAGALELDYNELRTLKTKGTAHTWQQLISQRLFSAIDFKKISGKALLQIVTGKFLKNNGLVEKYEKWIDSQPVAKFTGYVYELYIKVKATNAPHVRKTIDKQFEGLVNLGKLSGSLSDRKVICAVDTSGSMDEKVQGSDTISCMDVAISLGVYFASLLTGVFQNWSIVFSHRSYWKQLVGGFSDKCTQIRTGDCPSNTNFQSVIDSIVDVKRRSPNVPESDFPDTLLVVSDMQFDHAGPQTNYNMARSKLLGVFSREYCDRFTFIWWQVNGRNDDVPQTIDEPGGYVISGFDGAIVSTLLGGMDMKKEDGSKLDIEDMVKVALNQQVLNLVE